MLSSVFLCTWLRTFRSTQGRPVAWTARQIDRDDSRVDGMSVLQVVGQLSQAVVTPGDQHQVDALGGELSGEGFADPRRSARHHGPGSEAAGNIVHAILHWE